MAYITNSFGVTEEKCVYVYQYSYKERHTQKYIHRHISYILHI